MALLMTQVDLSKLTESAHLIVWIWIFVALLFEMLGYVIDTVKWQYLLKSQAILLPFKTLLNFRWVGQFFNNFLPSNIGGDATRIVDLSRITKRVPDAISSVVMGRITSVFALIPLLIIFSVIGWERIPLKVVGIALCGLIGIALVFIALFWWENSSNFILKIGDKFFPSSFFNSLKDCFKSVQTYKKSPRVLINSLWISVLYQLCGILLMVFIFKALSVEMSFISVALVLPIVATLMMIPLSINGLGVQDVSLVYFFGLFGVPIESLLLASLLLHGVRIFGSLIGGLIFLFRKKVSAPLHPQQQV
jgi:glycosyltransferase 2 family protein